MVLNYVAIGGGFTARHPADLVEFVRRVPDGAVLTMVPNRRSGQRGFMLRETPAAAHI